MGALVSAITFFSHDDMSAVCYYGGENIANLVPRALPQLVKSPIYRSQHRNAVKTSSTKGKLSQRTMGFAKTPLSPPEQFLKKTTPSANELTNTFKYQTTDRRPAVPSHKTEHKAAMTQKNFIKENAVDMIKSSAKKPVPKYVDTQSGHKNELIPSGLYPQYSKKSDYGKVPAYIIERQKAEEEAQREYDAYIKERMIQGSMKKLPDDERESILSGLKTNWEILHHQFQGLSVVIDTLPKKTRKEKLEAEMKKLERDIELRERHPVIYIQ